ncbi:MAG TPA: hypothetical protein VGL97_18850, partial [Bryobacteraceae bacterium]
MRSRNRELESQEVKLDGIVGDELTKTQEENLEKNGHLFARKGGRVPTRQLNGLQIQSEVDPENGTMGLIGKAAVPLL